MTKLSKLAELRAKTDRELVILIDKELELALEFALITDTSTNDFDSVTKSRIKARKICIRVVRLLAKVDDLQEHLRLEKKLKRLRGALEEQVREQAIALSASG